MENFSYLQKKSELFLTLSLPDLLLAILKGLRMIQDCATRQYGIPNLKEGYCLDDNARAL